MLARIVQFSIDKRLSMLALLGVLLACGVWAALTLPIDAMPDVSTIQVAVLTKAPGFSAEEVERRVTVPIENELNGTPGSITLRSTSRTDLSAVTVIFEDQTNVWFARQLVVERLRGLQLPAGAETPELAPVTTGLGEIYQFVVRSQQHSPMQLRTLLDWEIVPKLRGVRGVVEVNTMGGELKQYQVLVDSRALVSHRMTLADVTRALKAANLNVGGGYVEQQEEAFIIRGEGMLRGIDDIRSVVLRTEPDSTPVLLEHVAEVQVGPALRYGVVTYNAQGEAVTGIVMMLLGTNSREVVTEVGKKMQALRRELPPGVTIETVYDRKDFVDRTVGTVLTNLLEGIVVVTLLLVLFLGSLRGAAAVVLGIPASMAVALLGMRYLNVPGDLMSLGAIDFGFLVDGPIVILEAVIAMTAGKQLAGEARAAEYTRIAQRAARPVAFAVAIIMLVYIPLLSLEGVEGKMFRPMALTMACALFGALLYSLFFFPAVLVALVPPAKGHGPRWMERLVVWYGARVGSFIRWRWPVLAGSFALLLLSLWVFGGQGAEFVPRIFEGDAVVTIRRPPSIGLQEAGRLDLLLEKQLHAFPEVEATLAMTGRAEVAVDPVGNDNNDTLVNLKPLARWTSAGNFDELSEKFKRRIETNVPSTFVSVSQPIEDRTNEMISGSRADVSIQIFGDDIGKLAQVADDIGKLVRQVQGAGDVRIERILGQPMMHIAVDRRKMAIFGVQVDDAFAVLRSARQGYAVGSIYEGERRFELRVLKPPQEDTLEALGELFVETQQGSSVPLREVVTMQETEGVTAIRRENRQRAVRVDVNLRGRDLVSWVDEAQRTVAKNLTLGSGYRLEWGGQFENFERAQARLRTVVPVVIAIILGMLMWMFGSLRLAVSVFFMVPLAIIGGIWGLLARDLSFSFPAAVGFIALGGIAVLNGVVVAQEVRSRLQQAVPLDQAIEQGTTAMVRAVLTTAAVAAFGFMPMAIATGAGAEVQRPLATVVVAGMGFGTLVTLVVLPGVLRIMLASIGSAGEEATRLGREPSRSR